MVVLNEKTFSKDKKNSRDRIIVIHIYFSSDSYFHYYSFYEPVFSLTHHTSFYEKTYITDLVSRICIYYLFLLVFFPGYFKKTCLFKSSCNAYTFEKIWDYNPASLAEKYELTEMI